MAGRLTVQERACTVRRPAGFSLSACFSLGLVKRISLLNQTKKFERT